MCRVYFLASKRGHDSFPERFKSFPVQSDEHLWTVLRYVERNPVRAELGGPRGRVAVGFGLGASSRSPRRAGLAGHAPRTAASAVLAAVGERAADG